MYFTKSSPLPTYFTVPDRSLFIIPKCLPVGPKIIVTPLIRSTYDQWRRQDFVKGGEVRYGSIGGLEYEVPQSGLYCLCINVVLCSTALQCICRVIRRSSMAMKAHTYYIIFGRPPIGGKLLPSPLAAPLHTIVISNVLSSFLGITQVYEHCLRRSYDFSSESYLRKVSRSS